MLLPVMTDSPPTLDSGPGNQASPKTKVEESEQEVHHLQKELQTYMQKIEELARRDKSGEVLDPDEEARGRIRQRERIARSSRMLYVLQQQIKEIQSDLEQLSPQPIRHTKKSRTMSRLAAVHRGAIRALQMFVSQLSERGEQQVPALYKELGHLIRQLSLCTAKLDTGLDAAASKTIISLLQQVEDLDILLEHKMYSHSGKSSPYKTTSRSPSSKKECNQKAHNGSPRREKKCPPPVFKKQVSREEKWTNINRQLVADKPPESLTTATQTDSILKEDSSTPERRAALKSGLKALIQAGGLKGLNRMGVGPNRSKGVLLAQRPQPPKREPSQRTHFQAKTKSFMLKENRPSVREKKTPWVPPNPTSPPASIKRVNWDKQQKQMNDSPKRKLDQTETSKNKEGEKEETVRDETVRCAGLDFETARRMQELDKLYREEISCIQNLREDMHTSRTQDPSGNNTTQQQVHSLTGKITDKNLQNSYPPSMDSYLGIGLQDSSDLENMIQRMEEIEKYQETVRQRFNQIVYADPEFWVQEEKERASATIDQRPCSPHPIRITKPTGQREPVVDIFLGEPFEGDSLQISKEELAISFPHHLPPSTTPQTEGCLQIAIPTAMLHRIKDYSDRYQRHLLLTSHEEVGSFNPWHISESLAEQLLDEALDEVAEELQGICETYAEAIFTAEFLEPTEGNH
ncbi:protein moonraker isoform 2-T2 [Rhinophrynus dorsalis]